MEIGLDLEITVMGQNTSVHFRVGSVSSKGKNCLYFCYRLQKVTSLLRISANEIPGGNRSVVIKIIVPQIILKKPISQIHISGYFERYFNEELTFRYFTSNIIRVSIYMKFFGLNNLHDDRNRGERRREC